MKMVFGDLDLLNLRSNLKAHLLSGGGETLRSFFFDQKRGINNTQHPNQPLGLGVSQEIRVIHIVIHQIVLFFYESLSTFLGGQKIRSSWLSFLWSVAPRSCLYFPILVSPNPIE